MNNKIEFTYTYRDHNDTILFEIRTANPLDADEAFKNKFGKYPLDMRNVTCNAEVRHDNN